MKIKTDMSPEAITERLRLTSELRRLCLELGKAKPIEKDPSRKTEHPSKKKPSEDSHS